MLQPGKKYMLPEEGPCLVLRVDDCRAEVKLLSAREQVVTAYKDTPQEQQIKFSSPGRVVSISPNSEIEEIL